MIWNVSAIEDFRKARVLLNALQRATRQAKSPVSSSDFAANVPGNSVFSISLKPFVRLCHRPSVYPTFT
jgi:hypothetical protein